MPAIFINHRRDDVPAEARRIRVSLATQLGQANVSMADGEASPRQLGPRDVLIVVMGQRWLEITRQLDASGERDDARAEIASALRQGLHVIPLRVGRTDSIPAMPRAEDLPSDIRSLAQLRSSTIAVERLEVDTMPLAAAVRAVSVATVPVGAVPTSIPRTPITLEPMAGNSHFKLAVWAAGIIASTVLFANLMAYLTGAIGRPTSAQPGTQGRPTAILPAWTGEGRIRRAIEAALAKGRRPDEAQRCQSALIAATDTGTIVFETASVELDARSHQTLDRLAQIIRGCPDFGVEIEGHTDSMGNPSDNLRLSERRARSVRDYLERAGVPAEALSAVGYGETRPVAPNDIPANMARNRRIELNVIVR